ncbi:MAG: outer membrane protein assembly factor BamD [candidate division WOR-3 bacterium]|nr:outer membrane protein assembly factor BamD [candidate division WOR-3 bacterium]MDH7518689.1 outer membrane protein assembly factor BamD [bacterium]
MKPVLTLKLLTLFVLLCLACPKRAERAKPSTPQEALEQALSDKKAKRFQKAEEGFTYLIFNFPGSSQAADAQFYLADCYFEKKDYEQAQSEFDFYLKNFPNGRFQEEAAFKKAIAVFRSAPPPDKDQSNVLKAQELLNDFLEEYPESRFRDQVQNTLKEIQFRLVQREFDAARLYFKAGEYRSALIYYQFIKDNYPEVTWTETDRCQLAVCYFETDNKETARLIFEELVSTAVSPRVKRISQRYLNRLN